MSIHSRLRPCPRVLVMCLEDTRQEKVRAWVQPRIGPPLLVDRDLTFRLVEMPGVWDRLCQHNTRRCPP